MLKNVPKFFSFKHYANFVLYDKFYFLNKSMCEESLFSFDEEENDEDIDILSKYNSLDFDFYENNLDEIILKNINDKEVHKDYLKLNNLNDKLKFANKLNESKTNLINNLPQNIKSEFDDILENFLNSSYESIQLEYDKYYSEAQKFIQAQYKISNDKVKFISPKLSKENQIAATKNAIQEGYKLIFNPILEYKKAISKLSYYFPQLQLGGNILISPKAKNIHIINAYYDLNIYKQNNLDIRAYNFCFPYKKKKGINRYIWKKDKIEFHTSNDGTLTKEKNFFEILDENKSVDILNLIDSLENTVDYKRFDEYIDYINNLEKHEKELNRIPNIQYFKDLQARNSSPVGDSSFIKDDFIKRYVPEDYLPWSKEFYALYIFDKNNIEFPILKPSVNNKTNSQIFNSMREAFNIFMNNDNLIYISEDVKKLKHEITLARLQETKKQNFVWFDFEGFTNLFPIIDYHIPFTQLISQLSVMQTTWNSEINNYEIVESKTKDYVYDPLNYSYKTLMKIIDDIYVEYADAYVVYNQNYEKSRIEEIEQMLELYWKNDNVINENVFIEYKNKIARIIENLLDLNDITKVSSFAKLEDCMFVPLALKGKYSIKCFEKYITHNNISLKHKITPYKELDIQNGVMAMEKATLRMLNQIGNNEWYGKNGKDGIEAQLKKYCHNDVLAMIMTAEFILKVFNNKDKYIKEFNDALYNLRKK